MIALIIKCVVVYVTGVVFCWAVFLAVRFFNGQALRVVHTQRKSTPPILQLQFPVICVVLNTVGNTSDLRSDYSIGCVSGFFYEVGIFFFAMIFILVSAVFILLTQSNRNSVVFWFVFLICSFVSILFYHGLIVISILLLSLYLGVVVVLLISSFVLFGRRAAGVTVFNMYDVFVGFGFLLSGAVVVVCTYLSSNSICAVDTGYIDYPARGPQLVLNKYLFFTSDILAFYPLFDVFFIVLFLLGAYLIIAAVVVDLSLSVVDASVVSILYPVISRWIVVTLFRSAAAVVGNFKLPVVDARGPILSATILAITAKSVSDNGGHEPMTPKEGIFFALLAAIVVFGTYALGRRILTGHWPLSSEETPAAEIRPAVEEVVVVQPPVEEAVAICRLDLWSWEVYTVASPDIGALLLPFSTWDPSAFPQTGLD